MAKTKDQRLAEIHSQAIKEFDQIYSVEWPQRQQSLEDRRFCAIPGAQWQDQYGQQFENKPRFESNRCQLSIIKLYSEYRSNRITVDFTPNDGTDKQGDQLSDTLDSLFRACEDRSTAEEAYDNCFDEGCTGGYGALRLRAEYEDDEDPQDEKQHIVIEPLFDADLSIFFDLNAKRQDKSDARSCYVIYSMTVDSFREQYDDDPASWPRDEWNNFDWATPDVVYLCELYKLEEKKEVVHIYQHLDGSEEAFTEDEIAEKGDMLTAIGSQEVRTKTIKRKKVHKYLMSGSRILEDQGYIAGNCIPIIPYYGKRWYIDSIERASGHIRLAKDMQRLSNMQLSKLGEISALSPVEKPIMHPEQISGFQTMWSEDNVKNYPYLMINKLTDANGQEQPGGPVAYTKPPDVPPALAALLQITDQNLNALLWNLNDNEQMAGNISTQTAELIATRIDTPSYLYIANFARTMKRVGEVWLSMAKDVYVEEGRKLKGVQADGSPTQIELMKPSINQKTGEVEYQNDLSKARHEVHVEVGPTTSTKRTATLRQVQTMMQYVEDPETKQVLTNIALMNIEGEGLQEIREYMHNKLVRMGILQPTQEELQEMQAQAQAQANQPPDAQTQYLQSAAQNEQAKSQKAQVDALKVQAETDQVRVETAAKAAEIDRKDVEQVTQLVDKLGPHVGVGNNG